MHSFTRHDRQVSLLDGFINGKINFPHVFIRVTLAYSGKCENFYTIAKYKELKWKQFLNSLWRAIFFIFPITCASYYKNTDVC